jgi:hypothetical protein
VSRIDNDDFATSFFSFVADHLKKALWSWLGQHLTVFSYRDCANAV